MSNNNILELLDADIMSDESTVYPEFVPFFSKDCTASVENKAARLFDDTPEQTSHGTAPWDEYGWSRDGWVI